MAKRKKSDDEALRKAKEVFDEPRKLCWGTADKVPGAADEIPYTRRRREADHFMAIWLAGQIVGAAEKRKELEARVAELERCPLDYRGVWEPGSYSARSLVSHGSSMWFSPVETKAKPGEGAPWQLVVKHGRDGRDAERQRASTGTRKQQ